MVDQLGEVRILEVEFDAVPPGFGRYGVSTALAIESMLCGGGALVPGRSGSRRASSAAGSAVS